MIIFQIGTVWKLNFSGLSLITFFVLSYDGGEVGS